MDSWLCTRKNFSMSHSKVKEGLFKEIYIPQSEDHLRSLLLLIFNSFVTPWTIACQVPLSMGCSRQEYWSGLPFPSPGDLPDPGIEPGSPRGGVPSCALGGCNCGWELPFRPLLGPQGSPCHGCSRGLRTTGKDANKNNFVK